MVPLHLIAPFLNSVEGLVLQSYDDATGKILNEGDVAEGVVTIGKGATTWEDGSPIAPGSTITFQRAMDLFHGYIKEELDPSLRRLIRPDVYADMTENQKAAFGSFVFNLGEEKTRGYTLTKLINQRASDEEIARQWVKYSSAGGKRVLGLYRRRIGEVLLWHGLDWSIWPNLHWSSDVIDVMIKMGWEGEARNDLYQGYADPTPETPWTTEDLNTAQKWKLEGKTPEQATISITKPKIVEAPNVDTTAPPKPLEGSKTVRGISKAESGKETTQIAAVIGGTAAAVPTVNAVTGYLEKYSTGAIIGTALLFAGLLALVGIWRWWRGKIIAYEGRQEATQLKV